MKSIRVLSQEYEILRGRILYNDPTSIHAKVFWTILDDSKIRSFQFAFITIPKDGIFLDSENGDIKSNGLIFRASYDSGKLIWKKSSWDDVNIVSNY